jgi:hypothetical protein
MNVEAITTFPYTYSRLSAKLIKHRDNFNNTSSVESKGF